MAMPMSEFEKLKSDIMFRMLFKPGFARGLGAGSDVDANPLNDSLLDKRFATPRPIINSGDKNIDPLDRYNEIPPRRTYPSIINRVDPAPQPPSGTGLSELDAAMQRAFSAQDQMRRNAALSQYNSEYDQAYQRVSPSLPPSPPMNQQNDIVNRVGDGLLNAIFQRLD
jgi:hypothetical protein